MLQHGRQNLSIINCYLSPLSFSVIYYAVIVSGSGPLGKKVDKLIVYGFSSHTFELEMVGEAPHFRIICSMFLSQTPNPILLKNIYFY